MARRNAAGAHAYTRTGRVRGREADGLYAVIVQAREHSRVARIREDGSVDPASEELVDSSDLIDVRPTRVVPVGQRGTVTIPNEFRQELGIQEGAAFR